MSDDTPVAPRLSDADLAASRRHATTQIYKIEIAATPERIWEAITEPDWTARYGYGGRAVVEARVGGRYFVEKPPHLRVVAGDGTVPAPDIIIEGVVTAYDPPLLLATRMRFLIGPEAAEEPATEVRYEITPLADGHSSLTVTHNLLGAPHLAAVVSGSFEARGAGGGHPRMLRDLKSLLETGVALREGSGSGDET